MKKQRYMGKKERVIIPKHIAEETRSIANTFGCTIPKAFAIRDEIFGEIIKNKKTKKGNIIQIKIK